MRCSSGGPILSGPRTRAATIETNVVKKYGASVDPICQTLPRSTLAPVPATTSSDDGASVRTAGELGWFTAETHRRAAPEAGYRENVSPSVSEAVRWRR